MIPNTTDWVDRTVTKFREALSRAAPSARWLPKDNPYYDNSVLELGCGHYGCVMPTDEPDLVFKLTTDIAEAAFVRAALEIGDWPAGMIRYYRIYQLADAEYRRRPIFALWRQEATDVGEVLLGSNWMRMDAHEKRVRSEATNLLGNAKEGAAAFRDWLRGKGKNRTYAAVEQREDWAWNVVGEHFEVLERSPFGPSYGTALRLPALLKRYRGVERAAVGLRAYDACVELMEGNARMYTVGAAMRFYREHEIVLADVHANNVGIATHEDYDKPIVTITDPGHAVFLDNGFDSLTIEELTP